ncbi:hypothetical protein MNB_SUP05-5-1118 [hydrothermal vent metagenome]|uniref:Uncharacterized protein n=1 Tax=hydrothermal vent metagenome TaxID=652676 RepID=A0A1W1BZM2_9ZZZZ
MKKILLITVSMLFSAGVLAHPGHIPFEFADALKTPQHYFTSVYHIITMLSISVALIVAAIVVSKKSQILGTILTILSILAPVLGMVLLLK